MKYILLVGLILTSSPIFAVKLADINLNQFEKEKLKENQIRFSSKDKIKIHLQTNEFEHKWEEKTLEKDIKEMYRIRKSMYDLMGFSDVNFNSHKLSQISKHQTLTIKGDYKNPEDKKVYFAEINIYFAKKFLQVKIINENNEVKESDIEEIIKQIPIENLEV